jgi:hypothetical protein
LQRSSLDGLKMTARELFENRSTYMNCSETVMYCTLLPEVWIKRYTKDTLTI